jgi:hypothetical protein
VVQIVLAAPNKHAKRSSRARPHPHTSTPRALDDAIDFAEPSLSRDALIRDAKESLRNTLVPKRLARARARNRAQND